MEFPHPVTDRHHDAAPGTPHTLPGRCHQLALAGLAEHGSLGAPIPTACAAATTKVMIRGNIRLRHDEGGTLRNFQVGPDASQAWGIGAA